MQYSMKIHHLESSLAFTEVSKSTVFFSFSYCRFGDRVIEGPKEVVIFPNRKVKRQFIFRVRLTLVAYAAPARSAGGLETVLLAKSHRQHQAEPVYTHSFRFGVEDALKISRFDSPCVFW